MPAWSHPTPKMINQPNTKFSVIPDSDVMACLICLDKKRGCWCSTQASFKKKIHYSVNRFVHILV